MTNDSPINFYNLDTVEKPFMILTQGLQASGKTTYAHKMVNARKKICRVNRDGLRLALGFKFEPKIEDLVTAAQHAAIKRALSDGWGVIIDDTNLNPGIVARLEAIALDHDAGFYINDEFMSVSVEECIRRDATRDNGVGKDVILQTYARWWSNQPRPVNAGAESAIIVDIDGTLAHTDIPFPKAYDRDYRMDTLDHAVYAALVTAHAAEFKIILLSGREGSQRVRNETVEWLEMHNVPYDEFLMRQEGDRRDDAIVKKELYEAFVQGIYQIVFVIDDRPRVVRMWRHELGLKVFHVADDIDF